jgi:hypothetical protein
MEWYIYLAHFFAGAFLANSVPHFVQGTSGRTFQSPFASPPGKGLSSPIVNVVWGFVNFVIGYCLLSGIGHFTFCLSFDALVVALGGLFTAIFLAWHFGPLNSKGGVS